MTLQRFATAVAHFAHNLVNPLCARLAAFFDFPARCPRGDGL